MTTGLGKFEAVFLQLVEDLRKQCSEEYGLPTQVWEWFEKVSCHGLYQSPIFVTSFPVPL